MAPITSDCAKWLGHRSPRCVHGCNHVPKRDLAFPCTSAAVPPKAHAFCSRCCSGPGTNPLDTTIRSQELADVVSKYDDDLFRRLDALNAADTATGP